AALERRVLVHLNVLVLAVRSGDGELGFIHRFHLAHDELLPEVLAIEAGAPAWAHREDARSLTALCEPLDHLRIYHADARSLHYVIFQLATGKNHIVRLDIFKLDRLAFFGDAGVVSNFYGDRRAPGERSNYQRVFAHRSHLAQNRFSRRQVSAESLPAWPVVLRLSSSGEYSQSENEC